MQMKAPNPVGPVGRYDDIHMHELALGGWGGEGGLR